MVVPDIAVLYGTVKFWDPLFPVAEAGVALPLLVTAEVATGLVVVQDRGTLEQLLPLCANCKKYRTADGQWLPIEKYLVDSGAPTLTHGICPDCAEKLYGYVPNKT